MKSIKKSIFIAIIALLSVFILKVDKIYAAYDLTGLSITPHGHITWNNQGFSGMCIDSFFGDHGGGGIRNTQCYNFNSGEDLWPLVAGNPDTYCTAMHDYGMDGACCFSFDNYAGGICK